MTKFENIEPPEESLVAPKNSELTDESWLVVARNRRVNRDWEKLLKQYPENTKRCYEHLCSSPKLRLQGRVFPLRGKIYRGAWEYELTGSARVFYVPDSERRKVIVYYAGPHPRKSPTP